MNVCGIICEYDPFHAGHAYHIAAVREQLGGDTAVVCAMSGDFTQRGAAAAWPKHVRAAAAVAAGADLVLELPLPWCMAGAETFARGGVGLLAATGLVTHLSFGSECGDLAALKRTAAVLARPELDALLRETLAAGIPYAAARQQAAEQLAGTPLPALRSPNDILALAYLRALPEHITPVPILRAGAAHNSPAPGFLPSAAFLRERLAAGEDLSPWLPEAAWSVLRAAPRPDALLLETALLSRLRCADWTDLPDAGGEGLTDRLRAAAAAATGLDELLDAAAAKRYPRARLRRLSMSAALGLRASDAAGTPPYLRPLAMNRRGRALLRGMDDTAAAARLTRPAAVRRLSPAALRVFTVTAAAADLYALGYADPACRAGGEDWRRAPVLLDGL